MVYQNFSQGAQWLPFTPNRSFGQNPRVFVAADGMYFTTYDGRRVIDGISSLWCVGAGHNRREINEAIKHQLDTLDYSTAFNASNDRAFEAAERITALAPGDLNKVLFCSSGSEAADTSLKMALAYHRARGEGHRTVFIGRERGYHGVGFGGMSVGGIPANRKMFGSALLPRVDHLSFTHDPAHAYYNGEPESDHDLLVELEQRILPLHDPSNVAAIIVEPVAGSAGWYVPPKGYLKRLREICDRHGILLIFDEVITGFGRMGTAFGADFYGVVPDMLNFAKCVTNGVIPMGGVICRQSVYDAVMDAHANSPAHAIELFHGYTYSGHPVACAAAIATLNVLRDEELFQRAAQIGKLLGDAMHNRLKGLPHVISIRTLGLAGAVELSSLPGLVGKRAYDVYLECFHQGVLVRSAGENLVLAPAYIVNAEQIAQMVDVLAGAIRKHA